MASGVRPLQKDDDRASFRSGDADLDYFFHRYAGQNQFRHRVGVTYVYDHDGRIVAYMTVTAWTMEPDTLVAIEGRGFPPYPLPVLKIARLATAEWEQRRGYGSATDYYAALGFVFIDTVGDLGAPRGAEREMFLSLRTIEAALQE
ncbi:MAG: N-acetyltransferase [Pseudomonadota bacterium]